MANEQTCTIQTDQKNDGKWYYFVVIDGNADLQMGPYDTEDEAIAAGEKYLSDLGLNDDD